MVTSASPLDAQAEPKTLFAALDNNRINRRFHTRNQLPATLSCPCDASLPPYFPIPPFLQHILRPYLPVLVTFHFCNTFLQPSPYPDSGFLRHDRPPRPSSFDTGHHRHDLPPSPSRDWPTTHRR